MAEKGGSRGKLFYFIFIFILDLAFLPQVELGLVARAGPRGPRLSLGDWLTCGIAPLQGPGLEAGCKGRVRPKASGHRGLRG